MNRTMGYELVFIMLLFFGLIALIKWWTDPLQQDLDHACEEPKGEKTDD